MKLVSLAVSGSFLVMLLAVPSRAQVASDNPLPLTSSGAATLMAERRLVAERLAAYADAATGLDGGRFARGRQ